MTDRWNTGWMLQRLTFWRCRHRWMAGYTNWPDQEKPSWHVQACERCGVWRWFPRSPA